MSMTISAAGYLSGTYQTYQTSNKEKEKENQVGAGKTQQSSVSASLDQVNMGQDGITITEVSRQQGAEQSTAQKQPAVPRRDTVEISEEGRAASTKLSSETAAAEETQYEAEDLSAYTDTELKQLYYKGQITRQEYEDETGETLEQRSS